MEDCGDNGKDNVDDLPILDNSIESIAGEGPQSGVRRVVVASLKSRSCTVGHLGREGSKDKEDDNEVEVEPEGGWSTGTQGRGTPPSLGSQCS